MKEKRRVTMIASYVHGPKAAGQCYQCHETSSKGFRNTASNTAFGFRGSKKSAITGRLVMPLTELCTECHISKSNQTAHTKDLWLHGPVASGSCTACHDPHSSPYRYLLKRKSTELCGQCHTRELLLDTKEHSEGSECTSCHNAHMGVDRLLLKKDYDEIF